MWTHASVDAKRAVEPSSRAAAGCWDGRVGEAGALNAVVGGEASQAGVEDVRGSRDGRQAQPRLSVLTGAVLCAGASNAHRQDQQARMQFLLAPGGSNTGQA